MATFADQVSRYDRTDFFMLKLEGVDVEIKTPRQRLRKVLQDRVLNADSVARCQRNDGLRLNGRRAYDL